MKYSLAFLFVASTAFLMASATDGNYQQLIAKMENDLLDDDFASSSNNEEFNRMQAEMQTAIVGVPLTNRMRKKLLNADFQRQLFNLNEFTQKFVEMFGVPMTNKFLDNQCNDQETNAIIINMTNIMTTLLRVTATNFRASYGEQFEKIWKTVARSTKATIDHLLFHELVKSLLIALNGGITIDPSNQH